MQYGRKAPGSPQNASSPAGVPLKRSASGARRKANPSEEG